MAESVTLGSDLAVSAFVYNATGSRDTNYSGMELITYHLDTRRTYIKWDLSSLVGYDIISARIYYKSGPYEGAGVNHFRVTSDWDYDTITWNNQPSFSGVSMGATPDWVHTNTWYDCLLDPDEFELMVATNYGMCGKGTIADISTGYGPLYLVEAYRPYIEVTYGALSGAGQVVIWGE